jgi:hypothetical protein
MNFATLHYTTMSIIVILNYNVQQCYITITMHENTMLQCIVMRP